MVMPSGTGVELILTSQGWPEEGLTVDEASPKRPDDVRDVLFEALRQVGQHSDLTTEVELLHLELSFKAASEKHGYWKAGKTIRQVLESCRQKKYKAPCLERLFYEHGQARAVIALSIIPNVLLPLIEKRPETTRIRLAKFAGKMPMHDSVGVWIEGEFDNSTYKTLKSATSLPRPRARTTSEQDQVVLFLPQLDQKRKRFPNYNTLYLPPTSELDLRFDTSHATMTSITFPQPGCFEPSRTYNSLGRQRAAEIFCSKHETLNDAQLLGKATYKRGDVIGIAAGLDTQYMSKPGVSSMCIQEVLPTDETGPLRSTPDDSWQELPGFVEGRTTTAYLSLQQSSWNGTPNDVDIQSNTVYSTDTPPVQEDAWGGEMPEFVQGRTTTAYLPLQQGSWGRDLSMGTQSDMSCLQQMPGELPGDYLS